MMRPLTNEERNFATEHHNLVFAFLKKKNLSIRRYYDIVIFGYLKAVQKYFTPKEQNKCCFSTLAWKWMESKLSKYYKYLVCPKRYASVISLEGLIDEESILYRAGGISIPDITMQMLEIKLLLHDLSAKLSPQKMRIIQMKINGERMNEIARKEHLTFHAINQLLFEAYPIVIEVLFP